MADNTKIVFEIADKKKENELTTAAIAPSVPTAFSNFEIAETTKKAAHTLNVDDVVDAEITKGEKTFYLNLRYLLFWGFNVFFCLANNPFFVNDQIKKKITDEDKARFNLDTNTLLTLGSSEISNGINERVYKSGFNLSMLKKTLLTKENINKQPLVCFLHKFTVSFNDSDIKSDVFSERSYEDALQQTYQNGDGKLRELITTYFHETNFWCNLPGRRTDTERNYLTGYVFPILSSSINSKPIFQFFKKINENATSKYPQTFIMLDDDAFSLGLLEKHFQTDNGKQLMDAEIKQLKKQTITLIDLVKSLPKPFNELPVRYEDYTNAKGEKATSTVVYYEDLISKWNNVRTQVLTKGNANTYDASKFFIDERSHLYKPLKVRNFDEFYEKFIGALLNIVKCLLLYRDENNNEISIVPYLAPKRG